MTKENVSDSVMKSALSVQQSALQQILHVAAAIGDEQDINRIIHDPVNYPVGFKEYFTVIAYSQRQQFFWICAAFWGCGEGGDGLFDFSQNLFRLFRRVMPGDMVVQFFEVAGRIGGQVDREGHQRFSPRFRKRLNTFAAGSVLPSLICRLPNARIFNRAIVS